MSICTIVCIAITLLAVCGVCAICAPRESAREPKPEPKPVPKLNSKGTGSNKAYLDMVASLARVKEKRDRIARDYALAGTRPWWECHCGSTATWAIRQHRGWWDLNGPAQRAKFVNVNGEIVDQCLTCGRLRPTGKQKHALLLLSNRRDTEAAPERFRCLEALTDSLLYAINDAEQSGRLKRYASAIKEATRGKAPAEAVEELSHAAELLRCERKIVGEHHGAADRKKELAASIAEKCRTMIDLVPSERYLETETR